MAEPPDTILQQLTLLDDLEWSITLVEMDAFSARFREPSAPTIAALTGHHLAHPRVT